MPTGSDIMFQTALAAGIDTCFANPGTTEMAMVASLDRVPGMRAVPTMYEGVASGAADGYWRASGKPALINVNMRQDVITGMKGSTYV